MPLVIMCDAVENMIDVCFSCYHKFELTNPSGPCIEYQSCNAFKQGYQYLGYAYCHRLSLHEVHMPHRTQSLAQLIYNEVMDTKDDKAIRAVQMLGTKGITKILHDNKYGLDPGKDPDSLVPNR